MRQLGKITASSLLRYFFNGDIVLWRNFPEPLYPVARGGLHEIETSPGKPKSLKEKAFGKFFEKRYEMASSLSEHASRYSWVILAHPGILGLRNWDHLFENQNADVLISSDEDASPLDSFFAVRATVWTSFLAAWTKVRQSPIPPKNELAAILDSAPFRTATFERGEVVRPFDGPMDVRDLMDAAVVDLSGGKPDEQTKLGFALHMMRTFGDKDGLFLDLMES
jgi:hypothetical protein